MTRTEFGDVVVIDQTGSRHHFDADNWLVRETGHLDVRRDGKVVATFAPGFLGVYRPDAVAVTVAKAA